ncbi:mannose-6-phosphate isomerase, class I [Laceyella putida]|uniref:Mannose-6-phosphate isomerase n=1 Tax=Laceyella putida TaxID=110101 RepID=A0ABW2RNE1_9BACL
METTPIFLKPVFKERIWGGTLLQTRFNYEIPSDRTGECWGISAHPHGQSTVLNGPYANLSLGELWERHRELFGHHPADTFPLLTKILHAEADLSVQVHPDDRYAHANENGERGKSECWYLIDCEEGAEIIFGHTAQTKPELVGLIERGEWDQLLTRVPVKPGDFFYVPSGTIHALGAGTLVLETQQSSDTTYRVYDYDRTDDQGNKRKLHIDKAIDVTTIPHQPAPFAPLVDEQAGGTVTTYVRTEYFTVYKWDVRESLELIQSHPFLLISVIDGEGSLKTGSDTHALKRGDHLILPHGFGSFTLEGSITAIASHP